ncbi:MAG: ABC transporter ATP-binding protein, partial [Oscillospiraceae bacterium]|nr:ABC transporter ATP-binding protein [Oscillospiraceae bacterium]
MKKLKNDILLIIKGLKEIHSIRSGFLSLIFIRTVFNAITPFINIYMSALIIDGISRKMGFNVLLTYAVITISVNLLVLLIIRSLNRFINLLEFEFDSRYEMKISKKIISMDYTAVENPQTHRLREKINEFRSMNGGGIWQLIRSFQLMIKSFITVAFSVSLTASMFMTVSGERLSGLYAIAASPVLSIILAFGIIANVFVGMYTNNNVTKKTYKIMNDFIPFNRIFGYYLNDYLASYHAGKDIRIYNQKALIMEESMSLFDDAYKSINILFKNQMKYSSIVTVSTITISTLVYLFVGLKALAGLFGVGLVVRYVGSINEFTNGFTDFMTQLAMLRVNNQAIQIYFDFMEIPSQMYLGTLPVEKRSLCVGGDNDYEIEFRDVSFKYPSSAAYALQNVSLKFRIGERLAVVGMNGSGKTTFIKLLCRLYDPTEGEILLNGINIK